MDRATERSGAIPQVDGRRGDGGTHAIHSTDAAPVTDSEPDHAFRCRPGRCGQGYPYCQTNFWVEGATINAMMCLLTGTADGGERALFYNQYQFVGFDVSDADRNAQVVARTPTSVTVRYPLSYPSDPFCCPSAGWDDAQFQLETTAQGVSVVPQTPIRAARLP